MLLLALVALGLATYFLEWREWQQVLQWARDHAQHGWLVAALILLQVVLFMFALPGSTSACRTGWEQIIRAQLDARTRPCNLANLKPRLRE